MTTTWRPSSSALRQGRCRLQRLQQDWLQLQLLQTPRHDASDVLPSGPLAVVYSENAISIIRKKKPFLSVQASILYIPSAHFLSERALFPSEWFDITLTFAKPLAWSIVNAESVNRAENLQLCFLKALKTSEKCTETKGGEESVPVINLYCLRISLRLLLTLGYCKLTIHFKWIPRWFIFKWQIKHLTFFSGSLVWQCWLFSLLSRPSLRLLNCRLSLLLLRL